MRPRGLTLISYTLAVIIFVVVSTYAILYAVGYKLNWQTWELKKTGFILIESYPRGANINLSGKDIGRTTPATIKRLLPEDYEVRLTKDGYRLWQGNITVQSGLVTEQRNVLLTMQDWQSEVLVDQTITALMGNADNTRIAYTTKNEIWLWDPRNKKAAVVANAALIKQQVKDANINDITRGTLELINFAPDNQALLFRSTSYRNQYYLTVDTGGGVIKSVTTGRLLTNWGWWNNNELVFQQANKVSLINIATQKITPLATGIGDYRLQDNSLYFTIKNKTGQTVLAQLDKNGVVKEEIAVLPSAQIYAFGRIKNNWLLISTTNKLSSIWLAERTDGQVTWKLLADKVKSRVLWDDKYLIYKQGEKLTVVEWEKLTLPRPIAELHGGELIHFSFDTILYWENKTLKSIDLTGSNQYDLVALSAPGEFIISESQMSKLILIDAQTRQLIEATLRDKTSLFF
ncbi:MAG: PEGA domain-containing protein [Patescibacteria group bacterium]